MCDIRSINRWENFLTVTILLQNASSEAPFSVKVFATLSPKLLNVFFRIRHPKNSSHTKTLHTESNAYELAMKQFAKRYEVEYCEDDFVVLSWMDPIFPLYFFLLKRKYFGSIHSRNCVERKENSISSSRIIPSDSYLYIYIYSRPIKCFVLRDEMWINLSFRILAFALTCLNTFVCYGWEKR